MSLRGRKVGALIGRNALVAGLAVVFGLGAYAFIHLLIWILHGLKGVAA